jgi:single-strand DNA-binding protein
MADVNHSILIGRLTRDAELKYLSSGSAVCKFSIAVNRRVKKGESWEDEASFFSIVLFGKSGEALNQYLVKGKQVAIDGELHQSRWEKDGKTESRVEIYANSVQLLGGDKKEHATPYQAKQTATAPEHDQNEPPDFPDDIPF